MINTRIKIHFISGKTLQISFDDPKQMNNLVQAVHKNGFKLGSEFPDKYIIDWAKVEYIEILD